MAEDPRERVIEHALKPALDWPKGKVWASRSDCARFAELKAAAARDVLEALHDAGFEVRRIDEPRLEPLITSKAVNPTTCEIRAEVPIDPGTVWTTYAVDARYLAGLGTACDARFLEVDLPQALARQLLKPIEAQLGEKLSRALAEHELELPEFARG